MNANGTGRGGGFWDGFLRTGPLWLGVAPFGIAYALAARAAGLSPLETAGMSVLVYAGAAQFAATALFASGAGAVAILLTTLVVNLRHILLGASLVPGLRPQSLLRRAGVAFFVVDESYAMSVSRVLSGSGPAFLVGSGVSLYLCWQLSTVAGILLSTALPNQPQLGLDLVFPLSFFVLLAPYLRSRPAWTAAVVAACLALAGRLLIPGAWYLLIAAIGGGLAGDLAERRR